MVKSFDNNAKTLHLAMKIIPSGSQTFSKAPHQLPQNNRTPNFVKKAKGAWIWDLDNNKYLDYLMALGPIILGYSDDDVNKKVFKTLNEGTIFSLNHYLEVECAKLLTDVLDNTEMVKFGKTGSDANAAAIRLSRHITKKDIVLTCSYGGWHDWYVGTTSRKSGVPKKITQLTKNFIRNDINSFNNLVNQNKNQVACVILEPFSFDNLNSDISFLKEVREICTRNNIFLIFDEVVSGFRYNLEGASKISGVQPELSTWGKAMANGFPLSCITGKQKYMKEFDNIFFSGTFGGESLSLAACIATIKKIKSKKIIPYLYEYNSKLTKLINKNIKDNKLDKYLCLKTSGPRSIITFNSKNELLNRKRKTIMMQEFIKNNMLYFGINMPSYSHKNKELKFTSHAFEKVFSKISNIYKNQNENKYINGGIIKPIFRQR